MFNQAMWQHNTYIKSKNSFFLIHASIYIYIVLGKQNK